ncbi:MAG: phage Gp37/Gp68 family protein [Magnetovibrio sp.]|nr:phage Gp37/Gp68 family protein [Magnetovibrio sp.]
MTNIEWTEKSWNPIVGCSVVSPGCTNCYAMKMAHRLKHMAEAKAGGPTQYYGTTKVVNGKAVWTGKVAQAPENTLLAPLRRKKPTTYFVNSMGDLFHEDVPDEWIDQVFAVMALCPQHTFQVLTKRSKRMMGYMTNLVGDGLIEIWATAAGKIAGDEGFSDVMQYYEREWPLPNVWLGVSAEDQTRADERIPDLLVTPAAIRFVSAEPLLDPIDFTHISTLQFRHAEYIDALSGQRFGMFGEANGFCPKLDWIIVGGESGPGARHIPNEPIIDIKNQCANAGVACFVKRLSGTKGKPIKDMAKFPPELRVREMPGAV